MDDPGVQLAQIPTIGLYDVDEINHSNSNYLSKYDKRHSSASHQHSNVLFVDIPELSLLLSSLV